MMTAEFIACLFLMLFTLVATIDGIYFHLYKYRLYAQKESIREHKLHTMNAFLFPFTIVLLFVINSSGLLLYTALILTLCTLIIEFLDVFEEKKSRAKCGGLSSLEYSMHFAMSGVRATYTTIILVQKPYFAWSLSAPLVIYEHNYPLIIRVIGFSVAILGIPVFLIHYYLGRSREKR